MKTLFVALLAVFGSLQYCSAQQVYNPPVRWQSGTAAPSSGDCDSAAELGGIYLQTGNPASVRTQNFSCVQTGASTYAWMPFYGKVQTTASATCSIGDLFFDSDATAGSNLFGCTSANTWTLMSGGGGGGGTVTVVGAGSLTSTALATGGGSQTIQTPAAMATMDSSGNISTPGGVSTGVGGSVGGYAAFGAGTATTTPASSVGFQAPAAVTTKFMMTLPAAPTTGFMLNTGTTDPSVVSFVASTGTGNVVRATSPALVTPDLGTPSAVVLTNGTGLPVASGVSGLGTGVAAALAATASGTGPICLASGSACAGGGSAYSPHAWPFGMMLNSGTGSIGTFGTNGAVIYWAFSVPSPGWTVANVRMYVRVGSGTIGVGFYDSSCNRITNGTGTSAAPGAVPISIPLGATITLQPGLNYFALTSTAGTDDVYGSVGGWVGDIANTGLASPNLNIFKGNTSTAGVPPSACGSQTAYNGGGTTNTPAVFIQ